MGKDSLEQKDEIYILGLENSRNKLIAKLKEIVKIPVRRAIDATSNASLSQEINVVHDMKWSRNEKVRALAARKYFSELFAGKRSSIWAAIVNTSLFGFLFSRSAEKLRCSIKRIEKESISFLSLLEEEAAKCDPRNYTVEEMISTWDRFGIILNDEAVGYFREIHNIDLKLFEKSIESKRLIGYKSPSETSSVKNIRVSETNEKITDLNDNTEIINSTGQMSY